MSSKESEKFSTENIKIQINGEIYNTNTLKKEINTKQDLSNEKILEKLIKNTTLNKENLKKIIKKIDGDYTITITNNTETILIRDPIGIKPLYYSTENTLKYATQPKTLIKQNLKNIQTLKPGHILYKNKQHLIYNLFENTQPSKKTYTQLRDEIINTLYTSTYQKVKNQKNIGLLCSGGIDSAFLAYILKNITKTNKKNITLYAVGNKNSKDLKYSKKIAENLNLPLKIQEVNKETIEKILPIVIIATETTNNMKLGVASTIYLATKLMKQDQQKTAIAGQGADELFAGYNRYIKHIENNTPEKLQEELIHDLKNMHHVNLERDYAASTENQIQLKLPYLSTNMIKLALKIPIKYKIISKEDKLKKHILRDAATKYGVPEEISQRPKKAAQYGSGIDKIIKKKLQKEMNFEEILTQYYNDN